MHCANELILGPLATAYLLKQAPHNVPDLEIRFVESTDAPLECRVNLIKATTTNAASRLLARHFSSSLVGGSGPESQAHVDYWLDFAADNLSADPPLLDFKRVSAAVAQLNAHLKMRSFLIGHSVTLADLSVWGALKGACLCVCVWLSSRFGPVVVGPSTVTLWLLGRWTRRPVIVT